MGRLEGSGRACHLIRVCVRVCVREEGGIAKGRKQRNESLLPTTNESEPNESRAQ